MRGFLAGLIAGMVLVSCGGEPTPAGGPEPGPPSRFAASIDALCEARVEAAAGDIAGAEATFFDSAHGPLHELAAEAGEADREKAASLLEAKFAVEQAFRDEVAAPELAQALERLRAAAADAAGAIGETLEPC